MNIFNKQRKMGEIRKDVNTEEEIKVADYFLNKYDLLKSDMMYRLKKWEEIDTRYRCERDEIENCPNSFMPIILPCVEGQTSSLMQTGFTARVSGSGLSDQNFASTGQIITDWTYRQTKVKQVSKDLIRNYIKYGNTLVRVGWNADAYDKFGAPEWRAPQISKVFIDGKIKSIFDLQKAEYIIEEMCSKSMIQIADEYGEDVASAISECNVNNDFNPYNTNDDEDTTTLLYVWHRSNTGNLQLLIMSLCGVVLEMSDPDEKYHKHVDNKYPYMMAKLYPKEGELYGWGDGQLLMPIQDLVNKLYDEVVIACKFNSQGRTFVDPDAEIDPDEMDNDPSHVVMANDPNTNIKSVPGGNISATVWNLIQNLLQRAEYITRFSAMMSGSQPGKTMSATQAGLQVQQGNTGINDKKNDISVMLSDATVYSLGLCMEYWDSAQALRISDNKDDFEWVDAKQLTKIPVLIPASADYIKGYKEKHGKIPKTMQYKNETKRVVFDIEVAIGEGLPTSKLAMYNIILSLAQLTVLDDETGQPRPLIYYSDVRKMIEEYTGIHLESTKPAKVQQELQQKMQMPIKEGVASV